MVCVQRGFHANAPDTPMRMTKECRPTHLPVPIESPCWNGDVTEPPNSKKKKIFFFLKQISLLVAFYKSDKHQNNGINN